MKSKILTTFQNNKFHFLAFVFSTFVILLIYILAGVWPFGNRMILTMDLWGQYFPMISNLSSATWREGLLWSWKGGLGFNQLAQSAYYTNSPSFLIFALIPKILGVYFINYFVLAKIGFSALSFSYLLKYKFDKNNLSTAVFSSLYALSAYSIAFISQTMWFDAVILLPLIIVGFEKMMNKGKPYLYCATLFVAVFSNFYIAYSICIFMFLYFIFYQISNASEKQIVIRQTVSFATYSVLSAGASAAIIFPTFAAISRTLASSLKYEGSLKLYHSGLDYVERLLPGTDASLAYGVPNLYCSVLALILALVFIFNSTVNIRKRLAYLGLTSFMLLSFNLNILNYIWHGFHYPNQLPGRQSFIFCLLIILMAYEAFIHLKTVRNLSITMSFLLGLGLIATILFTTNNITSARVAIAAVLLLVYALLIWSLRVKDKKFLPAILCFAVLAEVASSCVYMAVNMPLTSNLSDYNRQLNTITPFAQEYDYQNNEFYRIEAMPNFTFNPGQLCDYSGITHYSSTMTGDGYDFFKSLGFSVYAKNVSTIYRQSPVTNTMFGVKYIFDRSGKNDCYGLDMLSESNGKTIYKNKYTLPIAFMCDSQIFDFDANLYEEPLAVQNDLIRFAAGSTDNVFTRLDQVTKTPENAVVTQRGEFEYSYKKTQENARAVFRYDCISPYDTEIFFESKFTGGVVDININGSKVWSDDFRFSDIRYIGCVKKDDEICITVTNDKAYGECGLRMYSFDKDAFQSAYSKLNGETIKIEHFGNRKFSGTITADNSGILLTSIPNDGGWSLRVDGERADVHTVGGYLCAYNLGKGTHALEFSYFPEGLSTGLIISIASIFVLGIFFYIDKKRLPE